MTLGSPEPLSGGRRVDEFDCSVKDLNIWLIKRALRSQISGATRTFVVCEGDRVVGYYALASGAVAMDQAASRLRRDMPDPIPLDLLSIRNYSPPR